MRLFENRVLKRIFGSKGDEVAGGWRRLHIEELHNLYASPDIVRVRKSKRISWKGRVAGMGELRNAYKVLVVKPNGKITLGNT